MMNAWSNKGTYGYVVLGILIAYSYLLLTDRRPVSYTHLDVYKRQILETVFTR